MTADKERFACNAINRFALILEEKYVDRYGYIRISQEELDYLVDELRRDIRS